MPLVVLLVLMLLIEVLLRFGWYDQWVKPKSFLGNALHRMEAIEQVGLDQIDWITVGDSRFDWGLDHGALAAAQQQLQLEHVRMSFESSKFPAIQATTEWSLQHMPNLKGVMLGMTENNFAHYVVLDKQYKVAWPFKEQMDLETYQPLSDGQDGQQWLLQTAWMTYFDDIKAFIKNPLKRFQELKRKPNQTELLGFKREMDLNLCAYPLKTLKDCINSTKVVNMKRRENAGFKLTNLACGTQQAIDRAVTNRPMYREPEPDMLIENWTGLIQSVLDQGKLFTLVLLPEHETHQYIIKPANASIIATKVQLNFKDSPNFKVIDLRNLFADQQQCRFFADPLHLNDSGIDRVTQALLQQMSSDEYRQWELSQG